MCSQMRPLMDSYSTKCRQFNGVNRQRQTAFFVAPKERSAGGWFGDKAHNKWYSSARLDVVILAMWFLVRNSRASGLRTCNTVEASGCFRAISLRSFQATTARSVVCWHCLLWIKSWIKPDLQAIWLGLEFFLLVIDEPNIRPHANCVALDGSNF